MYRKILAVVLSVALAAGILAVMIIRVWDDLADALSSVGFIYLIPACLLCLCAWLVLSLIHI